jgi:endonuclease YncB( thermonuclease family)
MKKGMHILSLSILIVVFILINYTSLNNFLVKNFSNEETIIVDRVIDGDTVEVNGSSMRLLGINTPEKKEYLYQEAKSYTTNLVLNKSLTAEKNGKDLYDRELVYLYDETGKNINKEIVREGYANYYFPEGEDVHYNEFFDAWEECIASNKNLCKKSSDKCAECIELTEWDFENEIIVLHNTCNFDCNMNKWTIKDEGRKKFIFGNFTLQSNDDVEIIVGEGRNNKETLYWKNQTYVWTSTGDTMFLRDAEGKLVLWESQGY